MIVLNDPVSDLKAFTACGLGADDALNLLKAKRASGLNPFDLGVL
jgi:hypothetical protein